MADIRAGRMVILVDDEDRENEGDLTLAADAVTPEAINFMATHGRGLICLALTEEQVDRLDLPMMAANNRSPYRTAFTGQHRGARGRDDRHQRRTIARTRSEWPPIHDRAPRTS